MKLPTFIVTCLLCVGCKPTPSPKYHSCPVLGEQINPSFLVSKVGVHTYLAGLKAKYEEGQAAHRQNKISDTELEWLASSVNDSSAGMLKVYEAGDDLWNYDNHLWNSFSGQSGLVLLRNNVVVWCALGKHQ